MSTLLEMPSRFIAREKSRWPAWWNSLSPLRKFGPSAFVLVYWLALHALGGLRPDHFLIGAVIVVLSLGGPTAAVVLRFLFPVLLTGIVYDSMRYYADYLRGEVHVSFPYEFDKRFFGIDTPEGRLTPNEWCQKHTLPILDLITGFFYLFFIAIYVGISAYHAFVLPYFAKDPVVRRKAEILGPFVTWAFFMVNMLGYSTYYWFPAAPPWYVAEYGLGPARMDTPASAAGAIRFDQLLGTHFFTGMYGRAADVFGAIPSLHVAYPLLSVLFAFSIGSLRTFAVLFYLIMCFSAVYLNHHYLLDILWGSTYAVITFLVLRAVANRRAKNR
ncbi:MAG: phosphatase PAP2 family protein [Bdellovibrionales bacterium]|nr:phosphatase PAP2 family protein [Bdellovibrionales bacterium]